MPLPPIVWPPDWSAEDMRSIGGFLLYYRAAILRAIQSTGETTYNQIPKVRDGQLRYYEDGEKITRWLLSYTPYPVEPGQLWQPDKQYYPTLNGPIGGAG